MAEERKRGKLQWPFVCEGRRERERERERPSIYETEWRKEGGREYTCNWTKLRDGGGDIRRRSIGG